MTAKLHACQRCRGTGSLPPDELTEEESADPRNVPSYGKVSEDGDPYFGMQPSGRSGWSRVMLCPTCSKHGPFGLVPVYAMVEGAFLRSERTDKAADKASKMLDYWLGSSLPDPDMTIVERLKKDWL